MVDVCILGNNSVPLSKIVPNIHTRANQPFNPESIKADVKRLENTHMFLSVRSQSPGGQRRADRIF